MRLLPHRVLSLVLLVSAPTAFGQQTNLLALRTDLPDVGASAVRALAALAIVLALFFGGIWLFRNGQRVAWRRNGAPRLAVLESRSLGNRYALYVVGYEQQRLLIGSSPAGMNLLSQLPTATAEANTEAPAPPQPASFAQYLQQMLKRK
jgi:flagellar biogenesis protein FliO